MQRRSIFKAFTCAYLLGSLAVGQTQNILTNGGFENGLMCYSSYVWNTANDAFASDYQFINSPDAHSGTSSLEIRCVTANCVKAAIISSSILTPPAQAYSMSLYSKCPAGREALLYVPGTLGGDTRAYLTCNGSWALNTVKFSAGATASSFLFYIYNFDVQWLRIDDVLLTYADGTVPQRPILHAGNRNVAVTGQQVKVDGSPYFALGFFDVPYGDLGQVASVGANTINGWGLSASANCYNTAQESYLDRAYEFGLNFMPDSTTTSRMASPGLFPAVAAQYAHHLAEIGWFLDDEPDQVSVTNYYLPPATLSSLYQAMEPVAKLPLMSSYQRAAWSTPSDTVPYAGTTDIWMAEPYGADFSSINHAVSTFNGIAAKPIWLAQDPIDATLIVPKAYWAAISGATGILYFTWPDVKAAPDKLAAVSQAFGELKQLTPVIFATDSTAKITPPAGVSAIGRTLNGTQYIIAANSAATLVQGTFAVAGLAANTPVQVMFENRVLVATAGGFQDTFAGVSRHVYSIAPPLVKQTPKITWAVPASITVGTALSATQLNATANVPGTFVYTPAAGKVLTVGNGQTLSVTFTPTDLNAYTTATASVLINVLPSRAKLEITKSISVNTAAQQIVIVVSVSNVGMGAATNVVITSAMVNTTAGTPLPLAVGTVAANASATATLRFPLSAGNPRMLSKVSIAGTYDGGTFSSVTFPILH